MKILRRIDSWIFSPIDARQIAALRIGLCSILLVRLYRHDFPALADIPPDQYQPLSYMKLFDAMPSSTVAEALLSLGTISTLVALVGLKSRIAMPIATVCALFLFGMTTSTGKVMHNDVLLILCLIPVAFGTTDAVWSVTSWFKKNARHTHASGWPWRVALLVVCGAYFFSGLAKVTHSGLDWVFSDNMRWILYAHSDSQPIANSVSLFIANRPWMSRLSGAGILGLELAFPLVLWKMSFRWLFVPAAVAMHVLTWFTLGLDYSAMAATAVVVSVWWPSVHLNVAESPLNEPQVGA